MKRVIEIPATGLTHLSLAVQGVLLRVLTFRIGLDKIFRWT